MTAAAEAEANSVAIVGAAIAPGQPNKLEAVEEEQDYLHAEDAKDSLMQTHAAVHREQAQVGEHAWMDTASMAKIQG